MINNVIDKEKKQLGFVGDSICHTYCAIIAGRRIRVGRSESLRYRRRGDRSRIKLGYKK